jgi:predicted methyltransferase
MKLTDYQQGQLLHIHFCGDFKYKSDAGTRVGRAQWSKMISVLVNGGYVEMNKGTRLTAKGRAFVDTNHLNIKALN